MILRISNDIVEALLWAAVVGVLLWTLAAQCGAAEPSPAATVAVRWAWLQVQASRQASRSEPSPPPPLSLPDLFAPYAGPEGDDADPEDAAETEPDETEESSPLLTMQEALRMALPHQTIIKFTQAGCPPCVAFDSAGGQDLYELGYPIIPVRADWPANALMCEYFFAAPDGATTFDVPTPTIILLQDGVEIGRFIGPATAKQVTDLFHGRTREQPSSTPPVLIPPSFAPPQIRTPSLKAKPSEKPEPIAGLPAIRAGPTTNCRMRVWGRWTWPGNGTVRSLKNHLCSAPHNMSRSYVEGLSPSQLIATHDGWHNAHGGSGGGGRRRRRR